jgi:hypothetical protein
MPGICPSYPRSSPVEGARHSSCCKRSKFPGSVAQTHCLASVSDSRGYNQPIVCRHPLPRNLPRLPQLLLPDTPNLHRVIEALPAFKDHRALYWAGF